MRTEKFEFTGHDGSSLAARLDWPSGQPHACAVFAHCFTCSKDIPAARRIASRLAAQGFAVLRFDFTGLRHSQGEFANTNFSTNVADLLAATQALQRRGLSTELLIGHSLGGAAVLKTAPQVPGLKAVVTIGAPADPVHVAHNFSASLSAIRETGSARVTLAGRSFVIKQQFLDDIESTKLQEALSQLRAALLVLHAPNDLTVGVDNAAQIFSGAKHPKSFVSLDDADHLLSKESDAQYVADLIASWVQRYVPAPQAKTTPHAPEGVVRVAEVQGSTFLQDVVVNAKHHLNADEPLEVGGSDLGPSPYQLLSAGLGACTTMTIRMVAQRKKMALSQVTCDVTHNKSHVQSQAGDTATAGKVDVFTRTIHLAGDLSAEQRQELLSVADRCPVHKTLHNSAVINTLLASE